MLNKNEQIAKAHYESQLEWQKGLNEVYGNINILSGLYYGLIGKKHPLVVDYERNKPIPFKSMRLDASCKIATSILLSGPDSKSSSRREVLERDNHTCQICLDFPLLERRKLEVHHIIPRALGGTDNILNLITLCVYCHDAEERFEHFRVYKQRVNRHIAVRWSWEIKPELLQKSLEEIALSPEYFPELRSLSNDA